MACALFKSLLIRRRQEEEEEVAIRARVTGGFKRSGALLRWRAIFLLPETLLLQKGT